MKNKIKNAFTFTELMIVVSVIGVIASFMVPALIRIEPNETALTYKKAFIAVETALRDTINDTELYPSTLNLRPQTNAAGEVLRNANNEIITEADDDSSYLCTNITANLNTIGAIRCTDDDGVEPLNDDTNMTNANVNVTLTNGATIGGLTNPWVDNAAIDDLRFKTLCIDVNGNEPPNLGCRIADRANDRRDQFRVRLNIEGKVYTGSSVGPNNWYMENIMLINPRAITRDRTPLTPREIQELTNDSTNVIISTDNCPEELGYILTNDLCVFTAGFTEDAIMRKRNRSQNR